MFQGLNYRQLYALRCIAYHATKNLSEEEAREMLQLWKPRFLTEAGSFLDLVAEFQKSGVNYTHKHY